jgi:DeoR/GlpR family transcriptional regulator of sugar metabolism
MTQTPTARQRNILELLDARHILTIQELAAELGVSPMTVPRMRRAVVAQRLHAQCVAVPSLIVVRSSYRARDSGA